MDLLERTSHIDQLNATFQKVVQGEGCSVFISGEAGIGKTALVRQFITGLENSYVLFEGYCDSLFAARPLGPLFDIGADLGDDFLKLLKENPDRNLIFSAVTEALNNQHKPVILFFEDIHWADEATLDFIRYLARRITQTPCLFVLTIRDTELHATHPFRRILGELPPTDYKKIVLPPLSKSTVQTLAAKAGREGDEIYKLTGGIPYYVQEVLSSYHMGIPESVRDSILSLFHRQFDQTKELWEKISVIPGRIEPELLKRIHPAVSRVVEFCFRAGIIIQDDLAISFKHELFRSIIEESLSPFRKQELHQLIVEAMLDINEFEVPAARIIHHARLAGDSKRLQEYAPRAAREAAALGSHFEASKFYKLALEHSSELSSDALASLYEDYSYECYLTNQIQEAIRMLEKAIAAREESDHLHKGNDFRFLSRLYWLAGDLESAKNYGLKAVDLCSMAPGSKELALAYSNMSQNMMLGERWEECMEWGEKAISLAHTLGDQEVLCHSLNNIGMAMLKDSAQAKQGEDALRQSLQIALDHQYHEHAARAYTNLGYISLEMRKYNEAKQILEEGIEYCDIRDLHSYKNYMQSTLAQLCLETGDWQVAEVISRSLLEDPHPQTGVKITVGMVLATLALRKGEGDIDHFFDLAIPDASRIGEMQWLNLVVRGILEEAWINDATPREPKLLQHTLERIKESESSWYYPVIAYWLWKVKGSLPNNEGGGKEEQSEIRGLALNYLEQIKKGNPYFEALWLSEKEEEDQGDALVQLKQLGAIRSAERVEAQMRKQGIHRIPRGPRASTTKNAAGLTTRQMDVLHLMAEGMQNKEIADQLFLSAKTIDHHISAILSKLDVHSRSKAVSRAKEIGLIK